MALNYSGVVQLVARQPLELVILVRVQAPEPNLLRSAATMNTPDLALGAIWYIVFLFSTTCHEAAHALVAKLGGDTTAAEGGQVTLNPIPHIRRSPFGMVVVPILSFLVGGWMIGWASAPFNPAWQRQYPRRSAWMALAGPAANFSLMILAGIAIRIGLAAGYFRPPESIQGYSKARIAGECDGPDISHFGAEYPLHSESASWARSTCCPFLRSTATAGIMVVMPEGVAQRYIDWVQHSRNFALLGLIVAWSLVRSNFPARLFLCSAHAVRRGSQRLVRAARKLFIRDTLDLVSPAVSKLHRCLILFHLRTALFFKRNCINPSLSMQRRLFQLWPVGCIRQRQERDFDG